MSLEMRVALRFARLTALAAAVFFLPAGTWRFWQGWAVLAAYLIPVIFVFAYFLHYDRAIVERRLRVREKVTEQKWLMGVAFVLFLAAFPLPGFDHRMGWSQRWVGEVPTWLCVASQVMVATGFLCVWRVLKENSYAGRTIEVESGQTVIATGPYARVRHPLYSSSLVILIFTPMALGSWIALPVFLLLIPFYVIRLLNEEKVLRAELPGYSDYCEHTPSRLIPAIW